MKKVIRCPQCRAKTTWKDNPHRPFCSERCRLIDLGNWADESYRIPTHPNPLDDLENVVSFEDFKNKDMKGDS